MAARTKTKVSPKYKTKYRVKNWAIYEEALRERGNITVWFDEEARSAWNAPASGRPGGQRRYSDLAIVTAYLENGVPSTVATDRRLHASLIDLMGHALTHPLGLDAVGMDETGLGPPGVMGREDFAKGPLPIAALCACCSYLPPAPQSTAGTIGRSLSVRRRG